ncbi:MAG: hypothetical protein O7B99_03385, partial [Planctomycetota bacterium]|nr:hypothetical protein [Planctomycetota bacterium]
MNIPFSLPLVAAPVVVAVLLASAVRQDREAGLVPVAPDERSLRAPQQQGAEPVAFDPEAWRAALVATDLEEREEAFARIVRLAQRDPAARDLLEALAHGDDRELAWTARLAQRELRSRRPL